MISVDKLLPFIVPYADGVPQAVARKSIIKASQELCVHSLVWQVDSDYEGVCPCDGIVRFHVPEHCRVIKVMYVSFNKEPLKITNYDQLASENPQEDWRFRAGTPMAVVQPSLSSIRLVPWPDEHGVVVARLALAPSLDAKGLPDDLIERFWPVIVNGALADIMQIAGQTYTNPQSALTYRMLFQQGVRDARVEGQRNLGRSNGRVPYQRIL